MYELTSLDDVDSLGTLDLTWTSDNYHGLWFVLGPMVLVFLLVRPSLRLHKMDIERKHRACSTL